VLAQAALGDIVSSATENGASERRAGCLKESADANKEQKGRSGLSAYFDSNPAIHLRRMRIIRQNARESTGPNRLEA
jgi:hypothetical protein